MSKAEAKQQAMEISFPQPGEILPPMPLEVFCAFMELHGLRIRNWASDYVVLVRDQKKEITS